MDSTINTAPYLGLEAANPAKLDAPVSLDPMVGPVSRGQQALWLLEQRAATRGAYNLVYAIEALGPLDRLAVERAFQKMLLRHEALRTTFAERRGQLVRLIHARMDDCVTFEDAQHWDVEALHKRLNTEASRQFDMARGPLTRLLILKRAADQWVLLFAMHHSVTDLWSYVIGLYELGELYKQESTGKLAKLRPLRASYTEYVQQQEAMLSGPEGEALWLYWRDQLAGEIPPLNLPTDHSRPLKRTYRGAVQSLSLDVALTRALKTLSQALDIPLYVILLAAFQTLLYRYTGQSDICIGSPKAGRSARFGRLMGYFVNPVVLRASFAGNPSFLDLLIQVYATVEGAFAHDGYPFSALMARLQPSRDLTQSPLFPVMFSWHKTAHMGGNLNLISAVANRTGTSLKFGDVPVQMLPLTQRAVPFEFSLLMSELDGELLAILEYNTDLFETQTIIRVLGHYENLLRGIIADPQCKVAALPLMTADDRYRMLFDWNHPPPLYLQSH